MRLRPMPPRPRPAPLALALLLLAAVLAGCAAARPAPTQDPVTFMISGDVAEKAAYEQLVAAFAERRPDVPVSLIHIPSQGDYRKRLGVDFAAGTPADIILLNYRRYAAYAAKGALEPLGPYLERSTLIREGDFYAEALAPFRWGGQLACLPQNLSSLVVYYNRDLFRAAGLADPAAGWSWDDFLAAAKALTRDLDGDGVIDQYGLGTEVSVFRAAPFIWQNGGELVDDPADPTGLALRDPAAREALQWFVDLRLRHGVTPDAVAESAEGSESRFLNGRMGMFLNSRRGVPTYRAIEGFDWDVAPLPRGRQEAGILHADAYCMPASSPRKDAAWAFIEYANSPEGQRLVAASGRTVPSLRAVAESPAFLTPGARPASSRVFLDVIPSLRAVPVMAAWQEIEDAAGEELARAYYGQASLDEALDALEARVGPLFEP
jgi:multiple sugar transport system substrate-binding protein